MFEVSLMNKEKVNLGPIQETLLITLWARAIEAGKKDPIIMDTKSVEILTQIDYDFSKLNQAKRTQVGVCLRSLAFDRWVRAYLSQNPNGTFVEIGAGLNTRFERLDNDRVRWFDLDLPDAIAMRKQFFQETDRRKFIAASVLDPSWIDTVKASGDGPVMFAAEGVLIYLTEPQVKHVFALLAEHFPGSLFAFDSLSPYRIKHQNQHDAIKHFEARFQWGIEDIRNIHLWNPLYQILKVERYQDVPFKYLLRMGLLNSLMLSISPYRDIYRYSLVMLG
jgi:O-methyltransferase involved in polyketide biosynthesis